jgi:hypothetical protein
MSTKDQEYVKYYVVGRPECNKDLDYTIDVKIDQSYGIQGNPESKMKQAAEALITEHNGSLKHNARIVEYRYVEDSNSQTAEKEMLRKEKLELFKGILSLVYR